MTSFLKKRGNPRFFLDFSKATPHNCVGALRRIFSANPAV